MGIPVVALAFFLAQQAYGGVKPSGGFYIALYVVMGLSLITRGVVTVLRASAKLDRLRAGYDAELAVGQELNWLMRQGAAVFHDVPAEEFNIDHVVIAEAGVYAVETKGYTKPNRGGGAADARVIFDGQRLRFPTWTATKPLDQAARQAQWLSQWLRSAVGESVTVTPVLALPGWFVEQTGQGPVAVFSGRQLPSLLDVRRGARLSRQDVDRVSHQVAQRCRTVAPLYRDDMKAA